MFLGAWTGPGNGELIGLRLICVLFALQGEFDTVYASQLIREHAKGKRLTEVCG